MTISLPDSVDTSTVFGYVFDNNVAVVGAKVTFTSPPFMVNDNLISIEEEVETSSTGLYTAVLAQTVLTGTFVTVDIEYENAEGADVHQTETIIVDATPIASVQTRRATGTPTVIITGGAQGPKGDKGDTGDTGANGSSTIAANFSYVLSAGTNGGAASTSWATRALNTTSGDATFSSLATSQITLDAGTYVINTACSGHFCNAFRTRLYDITNATEVLSGSSGYASAHMASDSILNGVFTVASDNTVFEIQQKSGGVTSNYGHGLACNFGESEIYTPTVITKIS